MATNNFKPFGVAAGANVTSQTDYEALPAVLAGFQSGKASSAQINKALRQGTVMSSVLAQFIADLSGNDVLDNGNTLTILSNLSAALKASSAPQFALIPGKNRLLNSRFAVNQRNYVSGTSLALNSYGLDVWKASTASSAMTFAATPFGAQTVTITGSFIQVIETQDVPTGTYTLSWTGTAQARIYNVGASAPAYASSPLTVAISGNTNVNVEFNAGTLFSPQLESGNIPTAFEFKLFQQELALCQRRCLAMVMLGTVGVFGGNTTYVSMSVYPPVALRAIPTIILGGASWSAAQPGVNTTTTTTAAASGGSFSTVLSFNITGNWSGVLSPGVPVTITAAPGLTIFSADL